MAAIKTNGKIIPKIIDAFGEWKDYSKEINNAGLDYSLLFEQKKFLKSEKIGFFKSRIIFEVSKPDLARP